MKKLKYLFLLIPLIFLLLIINRDYFIKKNKCDDLDKFKTASYSGIVTDKFIDQKNHRIETLKLDTSGNEFTIILPEDTSRLFQSTLLNDSIVKKKGESFITLYREGFSKRFYISWGCYEVNN